jgi:hypothetical protein
VLGKVGTISVDLKEMCKQTATREEILGEVLTRCRYLVGIGFGVGRLSLFDPRYLGTNRSESQ